MTKKRQRLLLTVMGLMAISGAIMLILTSLEDNLLYYHTPSQILSSRPPEGSEFRLGGIVEKDSLTKGSTQDYTFFVSDGKNKILVKFRGILPDLFREEQGVIATGILINQDIFQASNILAKHDENYMPPEVEKLMNAVE